jgi:hypothetical protein
VEVVTKLPEKPKYYTRYDLQNLPKKYSTKIGFYYVWINDILCDAYTNEPIIKNKKKINNPTSVAIMGNQIHQAMFDGSPGRYNVIKIKKILKKYFMSELEKAKLRKITQFPVELEMKFYMDLEGTNSSKDEDGIRFFYDKILRDYLQDVIYVQPKASGQKALLTANPIGIIPNDNVKYIIGSRFRVFQKQPNERPYLVLNINKYESLLERELDYRNIPYVPNSIELNSVYMNNAIKLTEAKFVRAGKELYDKRGEVRIEHREQYQIDLETYLNIIST